MNEQEASDLWDHLTDCFGGGRERAAMNRTVEVTPSCGCVFCDLNLDPVKLRRRWVHHIPSEGRLIACEVKNLKRAS